MYICSDDVSVLGRRKPTPHYKCWEQCRPVLSRCTEDRTLQEKDVGVSTSGPVYRTPYIVCKATASQEQLFSHWYILGAQIPVPSGAKPLLHTQTPFSQCDSMPATWVAHCTLAHASTTTGGVGGSVGGIRGVGGRPPFATHLLPWHL